MRVSCLASLSPLVGQLTSVSCSADLVETMKNDLDKLQNRQAANSLSRNQQSQRQVADLLHVPVLLPAVNKTSILTEGQLT